MGRLDASVFTELVAVSESSQLQVDEAGDKVRPASKRCTIILREIPEDSNVDEVKAMFEGCPGYQTLSYAGESRKGLTHGCGNLSKQQLVRDV